MDRWLSQTLSTLRPFRRAGRGKKKREKKNRHSYVFLNTWFHSSHLQLGFIRLRLSCHLPRATFSTCACSFTKVSLSLDFASPPPTSLPISGIPSTRSCRHRDGQHGERQLRLHSKALMVSPDPVPGGDYEYDIPTCCPDYRGGIFLGRYVQDIVHETLMLPWFLLSGVE